MQTQSIQSGVQGQTLLRDECGLHYEGLYKVWTLSWEQGESWLNDFF